MHVAEPRLMRRQAKSGAGNGTRQALECLARGCGKHWIGACSVLILLMALYAIIEVRRRQSAPSLSKRTNLAPPVAPQSALCCVELAVSQPLALMTAGQGTTGLTGPRYPRRAEK
jgi:hypothetical protein